MANRIDGKDAVRQMKEWHSSNQTGFEGACLITCRKAWKVAAREPDPNVAWTKIPHTKRHNDPKKAPIGAAHYWRDPRTDKHGHIALQSEYKGMVWSTDAPVTDKIGLVKITWFDTHWTNLVYLGWAAYINGSDLDCPDMPYLLPV